MIVLPPSEHGTLTKVNSVARSGASVSKLPGESSRSTRQLKADPMFVLLSKLEVRVGEDYSDELQESQIGPPLRDNRT
ncbi:hypothetical protein RSAG8_13963, partial [Rhizoctonia solani AG-8 WAC10335]